VRHTRRRGKRREGGDKAEAETERERERVRERESAKRDRKTIRKEHRKKAASPHAIYLSLASFHNRR
jgi:hypothetical protein